MSLVRVFLKLGSENRRFWNVEYKNDELYFMPSYTPNRVWTKPFGSSTLKFNLEEALKDSEELDSGAKFSYHRTGQFHWKNSGEIEFKYLWPEKDQLARPYRLLAGFTRALNCYDIYPPSRSLNRGGAMYRRLEIPPRLHDKRLYFEMWISPKDKHPVPEPLVGYQGDKPMWKKEFTEHPGSQLSDQFLLFTPINPNPHEGMQTLDPDVELLFLLEGIKDGEHHGHVVVLSK